MKILPLTQESKKNILNDLLRRSPNNYGTYMDKVQMIVDRVREEGDTALMEYTAQFDGYTMTPNQFLVTEEEFIAA